MDNHKGFGGFDLSPRINWDVNLQRFNLLLSKLADAFLATNGVKLMPNFRTGCLDTFEVLSIYPPNTWYSVGALGWDTVDINDVVFVVAPGAKPVVVGSKIIYYSADGTKAVVADVSGYLRVQDLTKKTRKRQYLEQFGDDAYNVVESNGKKRGRSKSEFQKAIHYMIKKRM